MQNDLIEEIEKLPKLNEKQRESLLDIYCYLRDKNVNESIGNIRKGNLVNLCLDCLEYGFHLGNIKRREEIE